MTSARTRLWVAAAGAAVLVIVLYQCLILPGVLEWSASWHKAHRAAFDRFARPKAGHLADGDIDVLLAIIPHEEQCFPTKTEWVWARLHTSLAEMAEQSHARFMQCLEAVASESKRPKGTRRKLPGVQVPGPQNNELQRTRDGNAAASPLNSVFYGP